ncbi:hypothetical protein DL96DRAFT_506338 [Flagelloscypha sp. PMI_526]|nr:hypothetical protein DL96DRAFT_506338 [Flagelloscypha sp. PMI_526]
MTEHHSLDVDGIFGSLLIGCFIACLLLGVTTAQFYLYLKKFLNDPVWLKCLAFAVWMLELFHQIVFVHVVYTFLVSEYGNPKSLVDSPRSIQALHVFSGLLGFIVRGFFIYRIYQFSQSRILLSFLCLSTIVSLGLVAWSIAMTIILKNNLVIYTTERSYICISALSAAAFTDVSISATTIWLLRQRKTKVVQGGLSRALDRLIIWTWETGLTTSGLMVFSAISASIWRHRFVCMALWLVTYRAYSNSFFAVLNGRITLRSLSAPSSFEMSLKERSTVVFANLSERSQERGEQTMVTANDPV